MNSLGAGGAVVNLEAKRAIRHGIDIGRGGVWLNLTAEQYRKLKQRYNLLAPVLLGGWKAASSHGRQEHWGKAGRESKLRVVLQANDEDVLK